MKNNEEKKTTSFSINYFPGHMMKAINEIKESIKLIDIAIEVIDSRLPISSRNYILDDLLEGKPRILLFNKYDLVEKEELNKWKKYFEDKGIKVIYTNAQIGENLNLVLSSIKAIGKKIYDEKNKGKKISINPIYRVAVIGIPNVGKSTIINKLSSKNSAKVGNRPGVTLKKQWIRLDNNIELMDTPGILWPKLDENNAGVKLALTGNIKSEVIDVETLAIEGINILKNNEKYALMLKNKYKLKDEELNLEAHDILEIIGKNRGCIISKGEIDLERTANIFLDEFKNGKIGKVILD